MKGSKVVYEDQSFKNLRFSVIQHYLDLSQFCILSKDCMVQQSIKIEACIIGSSHLIMYRIGLLRLYEVFACTDIQTANKRVFYGPIEDMAVGQVKLRFPNADYSFHSTVRDWAAGETEFQLLEEQINLKKDFENCIGLDYEFPQQNQPHIPKTLVLIQPFNKNQKLIEVSTAHSYPIEETLVFTSTYIGLV